MSQHGSPTQRPHSRRTVVGLLAAASSVAAGLSGLGQGPELERLLLVVTGGSLAAILSMLTLADKKNTLSLHM